MFWSKIWFFLIALAGAAALTIALALPRPAARTQATEEESRLRVACGVIDVLLTDDARNRVDLVSAFARSPDIERELEAASGAATLDDARMKTVQHVGEETLKGIQGRKPDFAILLDRRGRVVARVAIDPTEFRDVLAGRPLVDDALAGYLRDDLWLVKGSMYFVAASPVIKRDNGIDYAGAVVLGHKVTNELAKKLVAPLAVDVGFYLGGDSVAESRTLSFDRGTIQKTIGTLGGTDFTHDCDASKPIQMHAGKEDITAIAARLPGEAAAKQAYFTVFAARPGQPGFMGTLGRVSQDDLKHGVPWILVGGGLLLALAIGIGLMLLETDRPLRALTTDVVKLAKGEQERLAEDAHPGKFGSIARSVNIHIDKLGREAKTAKKDLDQLLGPAPEGSLGTIDLLATALPSVRPGGAAPAGSPPPSEFRFGDSGARPVPAAPSMAAPAPPPVRPTAAPVFKNVQTQPGVTGGRPPIPPSAAAAPPALPPAAAPAGAMKTAPLRLDDDILGEPTGLGSAPKAAPAAPMPAPAPAPAAPKYDPYFKEVYDQFIAMKGACGEPTSGLSYEKFADKLVRNRDDLRAKTGAAEVRFTVYVKDGKAALKATPV